MLRHLRVSNFAILSDVQLELTSGLVVLTGETGAGNSLIVEAVNLLRGGRASADIPRAGAREAAVEAVFDVPDDLRARVRAVLEAGGLPVEDPPAADVVPRIILRGGKSRTYVNGALPTATRLAELGAPAERAGLVPRVFPYVLETCAGDAWPLSRDVTVSEKKMFTRKRLEGWDLEEKLPLDARVSFNHADYVTWLGRPPWGSTYGIPNDGRLEPAVDLLGETEFSETGYFGNEASHVSFYATCAILLEVPPKSARKPRRQEK